MLTGCDHSGESINDALSLRNKLLASNGCQFSAVITADYGDEIYQFSMDCATDKEGNLSFTVIEPSSISGIKGNITEKGGNLTFDDRILAFQTMADGRVTPVTAPWLLVKTLRSGYINASTKSDSGYTAIIDDSYHENALKLQVAIDTDNLPDFAEIFCQGHRILTIDVKDFTIM